MLSVMVKNIRILCISLKYNMLREMDNRINFLIQILFMIFNNILYVVQWCVFYSFKSQIGGYRFNDIIVLWGLSAAAYGLSHIFFENIYYIPDLIVTGKLDAYITQPINVLWNIAVSRTNPAAFGDLIYGLILAIIAIKTDLQKIILFLFFSCTGAVLLTSFAILATSLTFWIRRGEEIAHNLERSIMIASVYPAGIFSGWIKVALFTIIPVGFVVYLPVQVILTFNFCQCSLVVLFTVALAYLSHYVFYKGLNRYCSSNLMGSKI